MFRTKIVKPLSLMCIFVIILFLGIFELVTCQSAFIVNAESDKQIIGYSGKAAFSMYLFDDKTLFSVGDNSVGQLCDGTTSNRPRYQVKKTNTVNKIEEVSTGATHIIARDSEGYVYTWGSNQYGQLGVGESSVINENIKNNKFINSRDANSTKIVYINGASKVVSVKAGGDFSVVLDSNGFVWTFGWNVNGQLGTGEKMSKNSFSVVPQKVKGIGSNEFLSNIIAIEAADTAAMALDKDGNVYAWGSNFYGLLGDKSIEGNSNVPVRVKTSLQDLTDIKQISASEKNMMALSNSGKVYVWGDNLYGQAGNETYGSGDNAVDIIKNAQSVEYLTQNNIHVASIKTATGIMYSLSTDNKLYGWGMCSNASMGIGTYDDVPDYAKKIASDGAAITRNEVLLPCYIPFKDDGKDVEIVSINGIEGGRGFVTDINKTVWSWGSNTYGQVGSPAEDLSNVFIPVKTKLEMSGQNDTVYIQKNYLIFPIIVICITAALFAFMFVMLYVKNKKLAKLEQEALLLLDAETTQSSKI